MTTESTHEQLTPAFFQNLSGTRELTVLGARFGPLAPEPPLVLPSLGTFMVDGKLPEAVKFPEPILGDEVAMAIENGAKAHVISKSADHMNIMLEGTDWDIQLALETPLP